MPHLQRQDISPYFHLTTNFFVISVKKIISRMGFFFQCINVCRYRLYNNNSFSHFSCISCIWCKSFLFCILYISLIYILWHVSYCKLFFENSTTFIKSRKSIRAYQTEILLNFPKQRKICVTKKKQDLCLLAKYLFRVI